MKYVVESKDKDKALTISKSVSKGDTLWILVKKYCTNS